MRDSFGPRPRAFVILDQASRPQSGIQKKLDLKLDPDFVEDDKASIQIYSIRQDHRYDGYRFSRYFKMDMNSLQSATAMDGWHPTEVEGSGRHEHDGEVA